MKFLIAITLATIFLFSCKKFLHEEILVEPMGCELCAWANSLEGEYDGHYLYSLDVGSMGINIQEMDSLHFSIEQVFLDAGLHDDSTRMFFEVTRTGGNYLIDETSIWVADDSLDLFRNTGFDQIRVNRDSITLVDLDHQSAPGGGTAVIERSGVFYRQ